MVVCSMSNATITNLSIQISMSVLLNINARRNPNALLNQQQLQQQRQRRQNSHHQMAMTVKEEHVTVASMETCVTLGNFVTRNFNFVQMRFFMKAALNANQAQIHGHRLSDSPSRTVRPLIRG